MNSQLKQFISTCQVCQSFQRNNLKESVMSHSIPDRPWFKIAADPFEFKGEHYPVLADYYSNRIKSDKMRDQTATETIALLLNNCHIGDFLMRLSLTVERISILRNFTILSEEADKTHEILTSPSSDRVFVKIFSNRDLFQSKRDQNGGSAAISCHVVASGGRCGRGWPPPTGGVRGASHGKI